MRTALVFFQWAALAAALGAGTAEDAWAQSKKKPPPAPKVEIPAPAPAPPPAAAPPSATDRVRPNGPRLGLMLDLFFESSRMGGEVIFNVTRQDESFDYGSNGFLSGTLFVTLPLSKRFRLGPGIRILGIYSAAGQTDFEFGFLTEVLALGEFVLPIVERWELVLGGRLGVPILIPRGDFANEIRRLQNDGIGVWSLPRVGLLAGLSLGARRRMTERLYLRADINGQLEHIFLFATDEVIEQIAVRKHWSAQIVRIGLMLGVEIAL